MAFLIAVVMLGLIIFVHELGHFLTAKLFKMPVSEFSIGMGPQVFSVVLMMSGNFLINFSWNYTSNRL